MRAQLQSLGFAIDWQREVATCDPDYYRWNQWLFLRMLEQGHRLPQDRGRQLGSGRPDRARQRAGDRRPRLAHRRAGREARDPDVLPAHHALRRRAARRRSTSSAAGRSACASMQANWIGRSEGCDISLPVCARYRARWARTGALKVFTTRADTLFGATFMAVAAEHPLALAAARGNPQLAAFIEECRRGSVMEADARHAGKEGHADRPARAASASPASRCGVGRQLRADGLRRGRRHGRAGAR